MSYTPITKIDNQATLGLAGTHNSLAYRVHEIETHMHSYERWFGAAAVPAGETHTADPVLTGSGAFVLTAGNNDWGAWTQIVGSTDTPVVAGNTKFDPHRYIITSSSASAVYFLQVAFGGTAAGALSSGLYTESVYEPFVAGIDGQPFDMQSPRQTVGTKVWARVKSPAQNAVTLGFYMGIHEYSL